MGKPLATFVMTVFALAVVTSGARAQDLLMGTWKINLAKSKYNPGPPPRSLVIRFEPDGANGVKYTQDQVKSQGQTQHVTYTFFFDGKDYPMTGDAGRDMLSTIRIDAYTIEQTSKKDGKVTSTSRRVISQDGKTMTTTQKSANAQGRSFHNVVVYEKQ